MSTPPVIRSVRALQDEAERQRAAGRRIALVPTMGALHAGHLSLVKAARERADLVWMSIFVNPAQFNDPGDFERYPVDLSRDLELCARHGVDLVFAPTPEALYPDGAQTWVEVDALSRPLCGAARPGHFRGVTTVVTKLFLAARPHVAVFGEKDFQQLAIIRRMERDLGFGIEIVGAATVREPDGLALSSRNVHLGRRARQEALALVRALDAAEAAVAAGERGRAALRARVEEIIGQASLARLDYAELLDPDSLTPAPDRIGGPTLLALAVHFAPDPDGQGAAVRLIDNRVLLPQHAAEEPK
jgi:pantoate--beta-alanine ligase